MWLLLPDDSQSGESVVGGAARKSDRNGCKWAGRRGIARSKSKGSCTFFVAMVPMTGLLLTFPQGQFVSGELYGLSQMQVGSPLDRPRRNPALSQRSPHDEPPALFSAAGYSYLPRLWKRRVCSSRKMACGRMAAGPQEATSVSQCSNTDYRRTASHRVAFKVG